MIDKDSFTYTCYKYLEDYVIAKYVAFYISSEYHNNSLGTNSFMQHFNSAADIFKFVPLQLMLQQNIILIKRRYMLFKKMN